jgi:hypothetical protein
LLIVTWCWVSSLLLSCSLAGDPIMKVPAGISTNFAPSAGLVKTFSTEVSLIAGEQKKVKTRKKETKIIRITPPL